MNDFLFTANVPKTLSAQQAHMVRIYFVLSYIYLINIGNMKYKVDMLCKQVKNRIIVTFMQR